MKILKGIFAVLLCHSSLAYASDEAGRYTALGFGARSCGKYLSSQDDDQYVNIWLTGYLTATNRFHDGVSDVSKGIDIPSMELWLKNWCKANPLSDVDTAVVNLVDELLRQRRSDL